MQFLDYIDKKNLHQFTLHILFMAECEKLWYSFIYIEFKVKNGIGLCLLILIISIIRFYIIKFLKIYIRPRFLSRKL